MVYLNPNSTGALYRCFALSDKYNGIVYAILEVSEYMRYTQYNLCWGFICLLFDNERENPEFLSD